jgi:hypothetical protein
MGQISVSLLASVPHVVFGIFDLAVPNIIAWIGLVLMFGIAVWLRLPAWLSPVSSNVEVEK